MFKFLMIERRGEGAFYRSRSFPGNNRAAWRWQNAIAEATIDTGYGSTGVGPVSFKAWLQSTS